MSAEQIPIIEEAPEDEVVDISESTRLKLETEAAREERSAQFRRDAAERRRFKEQFMARGGQQDEEKAVEVIPERQFITPGRSRPQTAPISRREFETMRALQRRSREAKAEEAKLRAELELKRRREALLQAKADEYQWDFSYEIRKEPDESDYMYRYRQMVHRRRGYGDAQTKILRNSVLASCKYSEQ